MDSLVYIRDSEFLSLVFSSTEHFISGIFYFLFVEVMMLVREQYGVMMLLREIHQYSQDFVSLNLLCLPLKH